MELAAQLQRTRNTLPLKESSIKIKIFRNFNLFTWCSEFDLEVQVKASQFTSSLIKKVIISNMMNQILNIASWLTWQSSWHSSWLWMEWKKLTITLPLQDLSSYVRNSFNDRKNPCKYTCLSITHLVTTIWRLNSRSCNEKREENYNHKEFCFWYFINVVHFFRRN